MAKKKDPKKTRAGYKPPVTKPVGRPRMELTPAVFDILEEYNGPGTVSDLCRELNISNVVFYKWMNESEEFRGTIKRVRDRVDDEVENALLQRARGFGYTETRKRTTDDGGDDGVSEMYEEREVYVPGDVGAQKHWLAVRRPEWNVAKKVEVSTDYHQNLLHYIEGEAEDVTEG